MTVKPLARPKRNLPPDREILLYVEILKIIFKKIKDLTQKEAEMDGFSTRKEAVRGILTINHKKLTRNTIELYCSITFFRRTDRTDATKSILFTHFKDKLLSGEKTTTVRMVSLPRYIEGEVVMIIFKNKKPVNSLLNYI